MQPGKTQLLVICTVLISFFATAQNHATTIKIQAMDMGKAWLKNDFPGFVKYMHPDIIATAGGKETMKTAMDSAYNAMQRFKVKVKKYLVGNPSEIVQYKNQLQAILPQTTTVEMMLGEVTAETAMIVISNDNGKNWYFIDTNLYKADKIKAAAIELSPKLVIPERKKPKITPKKNNSSS